MSLTSPHTRAPACVVSCLPACLQIEVGRILLKHLASAGVELITVMSKTSYDALEETLSNKDYHLPDSKVVIIQVCGRQAMAREQLTIQHGCWPGTCHAVPSSQFEGPCRSGWLVQQHYGQCPTMPLWHSALRRTKVLSTHGVHILLAAQLAYSSIPSTSFKPKAGPHVC